MARKQDDKGKKPKKIKDGSKSPKAGKAKGAKLVSAEAVTAAAPVVATERVQLTAVPAKPTLRQRQSAVKQKYRVRPDSALLTSAVHTAPGSGVDEPTRVKIAVDGPSGAVLEIGAHHGVGGPSDLPCSGDIFLASLAACQELTIRLVAAALSLPLHHLHVRVEGDWDVRGTLGMLKESPIGFTDLRLHIEVETEGADDRIERLLASAERFCVVGATLDNPPDVIVSHDVTNRAAVGESTRAAAD